MRYARNLRDLLQQRNEIVSEIVQAMVNASETGDFSSLELLKVKLGDWTLRSLGIPTEIKMPLRPLGFQTSTEKQRMNGDKRKARLRAARLLGRHSSNEWAQLKAQFGSRCVRCGIFDEVLQKDHILPIYRGGSDSIVNIQPLCQKCNCSKGPETTNWKAYRLLNGFTDSI